MNSKWLIGGVCLMLGAGCERHPAQSVQEQSASAAPHPVASLQAPYLYGSLSIDGRLDENAWKNASATAPFVNTLQGGSCLPQTRSRWLWNEDFLFVAFEVEDPFLKSSFQKRDDHLWEQDAVELLLDPKGDGANYYEIQVSPTGNVFDTRFDQRRRPGPFGHTDWDSQAKVGVQVRGQVNDNKPDQGYAVEIALPWSALDVGAGPPQVGPLRANLFILDALANKGQRACGWSPPLLPDFHVTERFGHVRLTPKKSADALTTPQADGD